MKNNLLRPEVQEFINENLHSEITALVLKGSPFPDISIQIIAEQIQAKKKAEKKLPTWFKTKKILYPPILNLSQTSSEITAEYKSGLVSGDILVDLTGGFGVDDYYFSKRFKKVIHCELNRELSDLVQHNFEVFSVKNCEFHQGNGITFLEKTQQQIDWIYADPGRRDQTKKKVFKLEDSAPNILGIKDLLFEKSAHVLLKTAPLLDLKRSLQQLPETSEIHIVAVKNEVKEILWILDKNFTGKVQIKTKNFASSIEKYSGTMEKEESAKSEFSSPLQYLYEPNAAILKAGFFKLVGTDFNLYKIAPNSHLYTSENRVDFPGRVFRIKEILSAQKKELKKLGIKKANISSRNFGMSVADLKKKFKLRDGGTDYLFFTEDSAGKKILIWAEKA